MSSGPAATGVVGLSLDGRGPFTIGREENEALCASLGVRPAADGSAHPSYYYSATQVGMGLSVAELCAACDFDVEDGPMLAGSEVRFFRPLMTDTPYRVRGEVLGLDRKASRKLGSMDLLRYRLQLVDAAGEAILETVNLWVLPRGGA
jgi:hypothetical protein